MDPDPFLALTIVSLGTLIIIAVWVFAVGF
jgi:hypothetical protein